MQLDTAVPSALPEQCVRQHVVEPLWLMKMFLICSAGKEEAASADEMSVTHQHNCGSLEQPD